EDIENALRAAGIRESVVLETEPGRIEAIVPAPGTVERALGGGAATPADGAFAPEVDLEKVRAEIDAAVKAANATLAANARIAAWRFWPEADFPRTLSLKVKRNQVRAWAAVAAPLPVTEAG
ncbi:MAG: hypothetical protein ABIG85_05625, partial [Chloroflexota bacterium]